jgi:hypothetical protein
MVKSKRLWVVAHDLSTNQNLEILAKDGYGQWTSGRYKPKLINYGLV